MAVINAAISGLDYAQVWGSRVSPPDIDAKLVYYAHLMFTNWSSAWGLGLINENQVRAYARAAFESEAVRAYWEQVAEPQSPNRRERTFYRIVGEEYAIALESGPRLRPHEAPFDTKSVALPPELENELGVIDEASADLDEILNLLGPPPENLRAAPTPAPRLPVGVL